MAANSLFVLFISALFIQSISGQCIGNALAAEELAIANGALRYPGLPPNNLLGYGSPVPGLVSPSSGGSFAVTSTSPIPPTGISIVSENAIEGALAVTGELPFLGAVALEGTLATVGAGDINYGCGNGAIGIVSEGVAPVFGPAIAPNLGPNQFGYGPGFAAPGVAAPGFPVPGLPSPGLAGYCPKF